MQKRTDGQSCVITDANILINFIKIDHLDILQKLRMYAFYISEEVYEEITYPAQRLVLDRALAQGWLSKTEITDLNELRSYARYKNGKWEMGRLRVWLLRLVGNG